MMITNFTFKNCYNEFFPVTVDLEEAASFYKFDENFDREKLIFLCDVLEDVEYLEKCLHFLFYLGDHGGFELEAYMDASIVKVLENFPEKNKSNYWKVERVLSYNSGNVIFASKIRIRPWTQ